MNIGLIGNVVHKTKMFKVCSIKTTKPCENASSIQKQLHLIFFMTMRSPTWERRKTTHVDSGNNNIVGVCSLNFYIAWKCVIITLTSFIFTGNVYISQMTTKNGFINLVLPLIFETQNYQWRKSFTSYISNTLWNTLLLIRCKNVL